MRPRPAPGDAPPFGQLAGDLPERRGALRNFLRLFWFYGLYREIRYDFIFMTDPRPATYIGYFGTDQTRIANVTRSLQAIHRLAAPRPVLVVFIPDYNAMRYVETYPTVAAESTVASMRRALEASGMATVDLLEEFMAKKGLATKTGYRRLFLPCDGHWNETGHRTAADVLAPIVGELLPVQPSGAAASVPARAAVAAQPAVPPRTP